MNQDTDVRVKALKIAGTDNVATLLQNAAAGQRVVPVDKDGQEGAELRAGESISQGHKIALTPIAQGSLVYKYGYAIGVATQDIAQSALVHVHNLASRRGRGDQ